MADDLSPIPYVPNFANEQILHDKIRRNQRHLAAHLATGGTPEAAGESGVPQGAGATGGAGGNVTEIPRGDLDGRTIAQMELQTNAFLKAIAAFTANQVAAAAVEALPNAQGVPMAQNTQELSLTTPVLFYGRFKDRKSILPNAFLMELEARQTRHGWEPSMLLRFVKSCLRSKAAL
jgi:hypothetical protein